VNTAMSPKMSTGRRKEDLLASIRGHARGFDPSGFQDITAPWRAALGVDDLSGVIVRRDVAARATAPA
jgi:hypothetical protein